MTSLQRFLLYSCCFLLFALLTTAFVWYVLVLAPADRDLDGSALTDDPSLQIPVRNAVDTDAVSANDLSDATSEPKENIIIPLSRLTESQQSVAHTLGVTGEEIVITPAMQVCAEARLGESRLLEIVAGDTPSLIEGTKLFGCFQAE